MLRLSSVAWTRAEIWSWVGALSFVVYTSFPSQQYAGDGLRWLATIVGDWPPKLGGTNHLLFPLLAWCWHRLLGSWLTLGEPISSLQLLNAMAAAVGAALFASLLARFGVDRGAIGLMSLCLIFASAYARVAVNIAEVMVSVPFIWLAIWLTAPDQRRSVERSGADRDVSAEWHWLWRGALAGTAIAVGTSLYQTALFGLAPALAAIWWLQPGTRRQRLLRLAVTGVSAGAVVASIYMISFRTLVGVDSWSAAWALSLERDTDGVLGRVDPRHLIGGAAGWVTAWLGLIDFQGVSYLLRFGVTWQFVANCLLIVGQYVLVGLIIWPLARHRGLLDQSTRATLLVLIAWFIPGALFLVYWLPAYEKLWLSPLAATIAVVALALTRGRQAPPPWPSRINRAAWALTLLTISLTLGRELAPNRLNANPHLAAVRTLASLYQPNDLVISDGNGPSAIYHQVFTNTPYIALAGLALDRPGEADVVADYLACRVAETEANGGAVYFLGVLDLTPSDWRPSWLEYYRIDLGLLLSRYRSNATPVVSLPETALVTNTPLHLWRYTSGSSPPATAMACVWTNRKGVARR